MASSSPRPRDWLDAQRRTLATATTILGVALVPKCPLCVAAYLASVGASAGTAAALAPWARPAAWLLFVLSVGGWGLRALSRRARKPEARHCCQ